MKTFFATIFTIVLLGLETNFAQDEVSKREIIALLELKQATKGHQWTNVWDQATPITQWHGVTIKNGKVVGLDLSNNNLTGKIPMTIGNLKHLESLDLSNNNLKGKIPVELRKFDMLKVVNFSGNKLTGKIPTTLDRLQNLNHLDLSNNNIAGVLPHSITELEKLNSLVLSNNKLTGAMPEGMEKLKKLKKIFLANNNFDSLENLKPLSKQQLVLVDVDVNSRDFAAIDFTKNPEGMAKLEFEKEDN